MKIAVVGGGSTYTPAMIKGLVASPWGASIQDVSLIDIDAVRMSAMARLCETALPSSGAAPRLTATRDSAAGLDGADFVILQIRAGGAEARENDETIPPAVGCVGEETIGAGGLAHALRVTSQVLDIAGAMEELCPNAWLLVLTNPTGIIVRILLKRSRVRVLGLCDVPFDVGERIAGVVGVDKRALTVKTAGLNHASHVISVERAGHEALADILAGWDDGHTRALGFPGGLVQTLGVIPCCPYMRCYYLQDEVLAAQRGQASPRAREVHRWQRAIFDRCNDDPEGALAEVLSSRQAPLYAEMVTAVVGALSGRGAEMTANLTVRSGGALVGVDEGCVVEVPCRLSADRCVPLGPVHLPTEALTLVRHIADYEGMAADAALAPCDGALLRKALLANPLVGTWPKAVALSERIVRYSRPDVGGRSA